MLDECKELWQRDITNPMVKETLRTRVFQGRQGLDQGGFPAVIPPLCPAETRSGRYWGSLSGEAVG